MREFNITKAVNWYKCLSYNMLFPVGNMFTREYNEENCETRLKLLKFLKTELSGDYFIGEYKIYFEFAEDALKYKFMFYQEWHDKRN